MTEDPNVIVLQDNNVSGNKDDKEDSDKVECIKDENNSNNEETLADSSKKSTNYDENRRGVNTSSTELFVAVKAVSKETSAVARPEKSQSPPSLKRPKTQKVDSQRSDIQLELEEDIKNTNNSGWETSSRKIDRKENKERENISQEKEEGKMYSSQSPRKRQRRYNNDDNDLEQKKSKDHSTVQKDIKKVSSSGWTHVRKRPLANEDEEVTHDDRNNAISTSSRKAFNTQEFAGKRHSLPKSKDGWLIAAPYGDRKKFKATEAELLDSIEEGQKELPPMAETEIVDNLVVDAKSSRNHKSKRNSRVIDYKGFRKNSIIQLGKFNPQIEMRVVLPKQSEKQDQLQQEQSQLEAQLREADALFSDRNSIHTHFKSSRGPRGGRRVRRA
mmetsp:Transcript_15560/g.17947  ORF Transcript_15560/g.17947 Transcript_15560/m.17947 type:complete len:386 (+) Transcript_15560:742-1899(+)